MLFCWSVVWFNRPEIPCHIMVIITSGFRFNLYSQGEVGGYSDISYIRRLGSFFMVQNFEFQYFLGFSEK